MIGIKEQLDHENFYPSLLSISERIYWQKKIFDRNKLEENANIDALKSDRKPKVQSMVGVKNFIYEMKIDRYREIEAPCKRLRTVSKNKN
ncbi:hypothetical protein CEXT_713651 [Caerostris extrusa]|uniref:Uncharacterized protein n=1 Tax=Caerostris extrusa TaxID=172846 RepID=A0AAV4N0V5_CAEEX|nr:hypothetical protein CEXT_713651 [Caerostris extrusa]